MITFVDQALTRALDELNQYDQNNHGHQHDGRVEALIAVAVGQVAKPARTDDKHFGRFQALLADAGPGPTLGSYLHERGYSELFVRDHLVPMASALWSSPSETILDFPAKYLVRFMDNHHMLQVQGRPPWRVVSGGSSTYIPALQRDWNVQVRTSRPVRSVQRGEGWT